MRLTYCSLMLCIPLLSACGPLEPADVVVAEATYGGNCANFKVPAPYPNLVKPGNATDAVAAACGKSTECKYAIDVLKLSDPANSCGKDFVVKFKCGSSGDIKTAKVDSEAHGKVIVLSCKKN